MGEAGGLTFISNSDAEKIPWNGVLLSVRPRIRLSRSFDQRSHTYLGYARKVPGRCGMTYTGEDWIDDEATSHHGLNEQDGNGVIEICRQS
jgi:hypothetical protein